MSTARQIAANRLNSQKSSGPRSAQGKAASSANSLKTGLYARSQVIAGEDPAELRVLADQYFLRWEPATPEESFLVATLINADWLLRRYSLADAKIWDYNGANDLVRDDPNAMGLNFIWCREDFPLLQRRIDSAERSFHRALHSLDRLQTKRRATPQSTADPVADPPPEAKANFAQPQSAQQKIGFVPSFSPAPESASPKPVQAAPPKTVAQPREWNVVDNGGAGGLRLPVGWVTLPAEWNVVDNRYGLVKECLQVFEGPCICPPALVGATDFRGMRDSA
ncbi:MAG TPA: hypothetical protein VGZ73_05340 [Bryobacteraceae bacterium]|nr:hypothetical protein [Bryobacteraceae bacterium]